MEDRYQIIKGHHGHKDEEGNTHILKPGDPIVLDLKKNPLMVGKVKDWPADEPWPLGEGQAVEAVQQHATMKTTQAVPVKKKAVDATNDPYAITEKA